MATSTIKLISAWRIKKDRKTRCLVVPPSFWCSICSTIWRRPHPRIKSIVHIMREVAFLTVLLITLIVVTRAQFNSLLQRNIINIITRFLTMVVAAASTITKLWITKRVQRSWWKHCRKVKWYNQRRPFPPRTKMRWWSCLRSIIPVVRTFSMIIWCFV